MSDESAFLAAIAAYPDEDTPRLAFADWLDEHDDPNRAAFIRTQLELAVLGDGFTDRENALRRRARELLGNVSPRWLGPVPAPFPTHRCNVIFRRGFVDEFGAPAQWIVEHGGAIRAHLPTLRKLS